MWQKLLTDRSKLFPNSSNTLCTGPLENEVLSLCALIEKPCYANTVATVQSEDASGQDGPQEPIQP